MSGNWPTYADEIDVAVIRELRDAADEYLREQSQDRAQRLTKAIADLDENVAWPHGR